MAILMIRLFTAALFLVPLQAQDLDLQRYSEFQRIGPDSGVVAADRPRRVHAQSARPRWEGGHTDRPGGPHAARRRQRVSYDPGARAKAVSDGSPRLYTLAEANASLVHLASTIARLRWVRDEMRRSQELLDILWQRLEGSEPVLSSIGERQRVLDGLLEEFSRIAREVALPDDPKLTLPGIPDAERAQRQADRRHWESRLVSLNRR